MSFEEVVPPRMLLEDGETVEVLVRFDAFTGLFLLRCHKLEREDAGMMSNLTHQFSVAVPIRLGVQLFERLDVVSSKSA